MGGGQSSDNVVNEMCTFASDSEISPNVKVSFMLHFNFPALFIKEIRRGCENYKYESNHIKACVIPQACIVARILFLYEVIMLFV